MKIHKIWHNYETKISNISGIKFDSFNKFVLTFKKLIKNTKEMKSKCRIIFFQRILIIRFKSLFTNHYMGLFYEEHW